MWYWDEWLQRALRWGKRTLIAKIVPNNQKVNLKFAKNVLFWLETIKVNPEQHKIEDVKILQQNFKKLWLYSWKIDWKYNSIKTPLINFQINSRIIKSKHDEQAWRFWPKTYTALLRRYGSKDILIKQRKRITIDQISYTTLKKVAIKLKKLKSKERLIKKLEKSLKILKKKSQKRKIEFLIKELA
jgi:hypothetical protein